MHEPQAFPHRHNPLPPGAGRSGTAPPAPFPVRTAHGVRWTDRKHPAGTQNDSTALRRWTEGRCACACAVAKVRENRQGRATASSPPMEVSPFHCSPPGVPACGLRIFRAAPLATHSTLLEGCPAHLRAPRRPPCLLIFYPILPSLTRKGKSTFLTNGRMPGRQSAARIRPHHADTEVSRCQAFCFSFVRLITFRRANSSRSFSSNALAMSVVICSYFRM